MASRRVHKEGDVREWIVVFWAWLIQVNEVYAHSPLTVRFFYHDHVGQPFRVVDFSDEICLQQLAYLFSYDFVPFLGEDLLLMLDRRGGRAYIEIVYHGTGTNP